MPPARADLRRARGLPMAHGLQRNVLEVVVQQPMPSVGQGRLDPHCATLNTN